MALTMQKMTLREFRDRLGLSQTAFAERAGLHRGYLCQIERGHQKVGHRTALKILNAFRAEMLGAGLTLEDLLDVEAA